MGLDELHAAGLGFIESFDSRYPTRVLETLLCDRTTGRNIIWADNEYEALGDGYRGDDEITVEKITGLSSGVIKPRIAKEQERQSQRTKTRAEVFTPSWLVNRMNNDIDVVWFGRRDVFNAEDGRTWHTNQESVAFPKTKGHGWHAYVESPRLEITCGEAPFVCSRYDTVTGNALPVGLRIGFLDRKLRIVSEKTRSRKEWMRWALAALKASYGFEYQGDNLLIARVNVFETFCEHLRARWGAGISDEEMDQAAWIVSWNLWQMNGLTCAVPTDKMDAVVQSALTGYEEPVPEPMQPTLFDLLDEPLFEDVAEEAKEEEPDETVPLCVIYDWQENEPLEFQAMKGKARPMGKKFYAVIGNPPYQEEFSDEGNKTYAKPVYNDFMDAAEEVSERVELITPARFLFNAGSTPKDWNKKKLNDRHFKVLSYEEDATKVFANTDIKGGVAITYRDASKDFGAIEVFTKDPELTSILSKVVHCTGFVGLDTEMFIQNCFNLDALYSDYPEYCEALGSEGKDRRFETSIFERIPQFADEKADEDDIRVLGVRNGQRIWKYFPRRYIDTSHDNLDKYKVIVAKSSGSGVFGERLSSPLVLKPSEAYTRTFISIGAFEAESFARNALKYAQSKFLRAMLGILKTTQHNPVKTWKYIPLQDFTSSSDIDWSKPVPDIDRQLYAKYRLTDEEIDFIESHVKEMD